MIPRSKFKKIDSKELDSKGHPKWSFEVLKTPEKQTYDFISLQEYTNIVTDASGKSDGYTYWHGYISALEVRDKKFPLDANPRKPSPTPITKNMQVTLQKHPTEFHHWNNGMTIICESITKVKGKPNQFEISFGTPIKKHGDGICNGGHTYYSIVKSNLPLTKNQTVRVELVILPAGLSSVEREDIIKNIAQKRNDNNELDDKTLAHYSGSYDKFITELGADSHTVRWFAGDPNATKDALDATKLIGLLTTIDPYWFPHQLTTTKNTKDGSFHMSSARNPGTKHKSWAKEAVTPLSQKNLDHMVPLTRDLLELIDYVNHSLLTDDYTSITAKPKGTSLWKYFKQDGDKYPLYFHPKSTPKKSILGYKLPFTVKALLAGAFRKNVWIGNDPKGAGITYVGWYMEPKKLWNDSTHGMYLNYMSKLFGVSKTIKAPSFGNAFIQSPGAYSIQCSELLWGMVGQPTEKPEIIYSTSKSSDKWVMENNPKKVTHYLDITKIHKPGAANPHPPMVEMKVGSPPSTSQQGYRKI